MGQDRTIEQFGHDLRDTVDGVARLVADTDRETFMTSFTDRGGSLDALGRASS